MFSDRLMLRPLDLYLRVRDRIPRPSYIVICKYSLNRDSANLSSLSSVSIKPSVGVSSKKRILGLFLSPAVGLQSPRSVTWVSSGVQLEGLQNTAIMSTDTADGGDDEVRSSSQQSPLASQRKSASNTSKRTGGYFTLGYKEGFNQWVSKGS